MRLSELIDLLQKVQKAEGTFDPHVRVRAGNKVFNVADVGTFGSSTYLWGDFNPHICDECGYADTDCDCDK